MKIMNDKAGPAIQNGPGPENGGNTIVKEIYIVLTDTGTVLSKIIRRYTGCPLNHVSIAFDERLNEMYSFGRVQQHNPFSGGFVKERAGEGLLKDARCAVFRFRVTEDEHRRIRERILEIERERDRYTYNFIGLIGVILNREICRKRAYFCSQFVVEILASAGLKITDEPAWRAQARHFSQSDHLEPVYEGPLRNYVSPANVVTIRPRRGIRARLLRVPFRRAAS
ncbi:hypothetical protein [Bhargavaea beijingensis]|uniref:hypothetical protein n=1 Tax=Bhargavaea beijingensis TaxID=426756 RepID=UPI00163B100B|nr:hypothetical protein [Bhargavaea beijingensis]